MKKFNQWYSEAIEDGKIEMPLKSDSDDFDIDIDEPDAAKPFKMATGLGTAGKYASMASTAGQKKTYNLRQIEDLVNTFISQFNKPSEQRTVVRLLRKKLLHAKDMFKPESESM